MRPHCARCLRARCLCGLALQPPLAHSVELIVLQHPLEQFEAKGTARLLALSLAHCQILVGEDFERPANPEGRVEALLYPGDGEALAPGVPPDRLRLFLLDGTWRKSRLLLHRNPWLQSLPRVALHEAPPTAYAIRRAQATHQLSTLEAAQLALGQLEGDADRFAPLNGVLAGLVREIEGFRSA